MKKFAKMLALGLVTAMVFGMAVQAKPSIDTSSYVGGTVEGDRTDVKSNDLNEEVKAAVVEKIESDPAVVEAVGQEKVVVVGGFDLEIVDEAAKGTEVTVAIPGVKKENKYLLLHFSDSYELIETIVIDNAADGKISFTLKSASPYVLVDMGVKAVDPAPQQPSNDNNGSTEAAPATSPKTGEALPVAGIMALVLMAGAVICAGKARYNR